MTMNTIENLHIPIEYPRAKLSESMPRPQMDNDIKYSEKIYTTTKESRSPQFEPKISSRSSNLRTGDCIDGDALSDVEKDYSSATKSKSMSCSRSEAKNPDSAPNHSYDGSSESSQCSCSSVSLSRHSENEQPMKREKSNELNESGELDYNDPDDCRRSDYLSKNSTLRRNVSHYPTPMVDIPRPQKRPHSQPRQNVTDQDLKSTVAQNWPTPIPVKSLTNTQSMYSTLDILSVFKYHIHYSHLLAWVRALMEIYHKWRRGQPISTLNIPSIQLYDSQNFAQEVMKKRAGKQKSEQLEDKSSVRNSKLGKTKFPDLQRNQLWKRRYYNLLNAVDFVYKDYQLLYYVCKEGLFEFVSDPPSLPLDTRSKINDFTKVIVPAKIEDLHNLAAIGTDPASHLAERVSQILTMDMNFKASGKQFKEKWPGCFLLSVTFLSDVISQSRILRNDLERRLAVHDRLIYVLGQAREQRIKLRAHMTRQKELLGNLTDNLETARNKLMAYSPMPDLPSSIRDGLIKQVDSPFVEADHLAGSMRKSKSDLHEYLIPTEAQRFGKYQYRQKLAELKSQIAGLERVLKEEEARRKRLHNHIQELTGNIRVFCRLRPSSNRKLLGNDEVKEYLRVSSDDKLLFCPDTLKEQLRNQARTNGGSCGTCSRGVSGMFSCGSVSSYGSTSITPKCFIFDKVFGPDSSQQDVYGEVEDLIVSCIDGYNVCIMAYGQTGSGKTYTMMGTDEEPGVNRRAVMHLFEKCQKRKHWRYTIFMSMVEIYQEDVFDLLEDVGQESDILDNFGASKISQTGGGRSVSRDRGLKARNLRQNIPWNSWTNRQSRPGFIQTNEIKPRRRGSVRILSNQTDELVLKNLNERVVNNESEMFRYLELAEKQRRVGSTRLNICSSRSHLVILLRVIGENEVHMTSSRGTLTLADLAGSENVTKSGSTGERFLEAACINKSLSSLGRVFDALRRQKKPTYRETKLTYLLRPSLGGESKCLLFIALRTEPEHAEESWRAIHFGQGALQVVPGGNIDPNHSHNTSNRSAFHPSISSYLSTGLKSSISLSSNMKLNQQKKCISKEVQPSNTSTRSTYGTTIPTKKRV